MNKLIENGRRDFPDRYYRLRQIKMNCPGRCDDQDNSYTAGATRWSSRIKKGKLGGDSELVTACRDPFSMSGQKLGVSYKVWQKQRDYDLLECLAASLDEPSDEDSISVAAKPVRGWMEGIGDRFPSAGPAHPVKRMSDCSVSSLGEVTVESEASRQLIECDVDHGMGLVRASIQQALTESEQGSFIAGDAGSREAVATLVAEATVLPSAGKGKVSGVLGRSHVCLVNGPVWRYGDRVCIGYIYVRCDWSPTRLFAPLPTWRGFTFLP